MELNINNKSKTFGQNSLSIQQMLDLEAPNKQKGIAVAINQTVIPKSDWETTLLKSSDQILIITATQGG
jgi:sulfur carrier protein